MKLIITVLLFTSLAWGQDHFLLAAKQQEDSGPANIYAPANVLNDQNETSDLPTGIITTGSGNHTITLESSDTDTGSFAMKLTHTGAINESTGIRIPLTGLANSTTYTVTVRFKRLTGSNNWQLLLDDSFGWTVDSVNNDMTTIYDSYVLTSTTAASGTPYLRLNGTSGADGGDSMIIAWVFVATP